MTHSFSSILTPYLWKVPEHTANKILVNLQSSQGRVRGSSFGNRQDIPPQKKQQKEFSKIGSILVVKILKAECVRAVFDISLTIMLQQISKGSGQYYIGMTVDLDKSFR